MCPTVSLVRVSKYSNFSDFVGKSVNQSLAKRVAGLLIALAFNVNPPNVGTLHTNKSPSMPAKIKWNLRYQVIR